MTRSGAGRDRFPVALCVIALAGLAWRVAYVVWMRHGAVSGDGYTYHTGANLLADGHGYINPLVWGLTGKSVQDAVHPPAWEALLTASSLLGLRSWLSHQLVACLIGGATIVMVGLAGRAASRPRTGLIAAGLAAVYPNVWMYERDLLSEPLAMLGTATTIWLAYRFRAKPGVGLAVALGAAVGVMAMTRAEMIVLSAILVAPLVLSASRIDWRRRVGWLALAGTACVLVIAPWALYNETRFREHVPLSAGLGGALLAANCDPTFHGDRLGFFFRGCLLQGASDPDPSVADVQNRHRATTYMKAHKSRVPVVVLARFGRTFSLFRPFQQVHFEADRLTHLWVIRAGLFMYWALLPLAAVGAVVARRRRIVLYPLLAFPLSVLIAVAPTIGAVRYRAPAEITLVVLAALALDALSQRFEGRRDVGQIAQSPASPSQPVEVTV